MDGIAASAGHVLAATYLVYIGVLAGLGFLGVHAVVLALLLSRRWRARRAIRLLLDVVYGFINPLIHLVLFQPYGVFRPRTPADTWLDAAAWVLFAAIWGTRLALPGAAELSALARSRLRRLCLLGMGCLAAFALSDLLRIWLPKTIESVSVGDSLVGPLWALLAFAPLYLIPLALLNDYRARLAAPPAAPAGFLLLSQRLTLPVVTSAGALLLSTVAASAYRSSDEATRERIDALRPAIAESAGRYGVDPAVVAAIVYVTHRDQLEPVRDHLERLAAGVFLEDDKSHMLLARPFDVSIGAAQIKPITALTALKLCQEAGREWGLWYKHLRDVPQLGSEWQLRPEALAVCQPPVSPVPVNKQQVVSALLRDESNVAFAAFILALYQRQWRDANPAWDISGRPEILATLYQIGFARSHPHGAPRSNAFGDRVAQVYRQDWLLERFADFQR